MWTKDLEGFLTELDKLEKRLSKGSGKKGSG